MSAPKLRDRVLAVAEELLLRKKYVAPVDVFAGLGWLSGLAVRDWEHGLCARLPVTTAHTTAGNALDLLVTWGTRRGLDRVEVDYRSSTQDRSLLVFGIGAEQTCRTHWVRQEQASRPALRRAESPDLIAIEPVTPWACAQCGETGTYRVMEADRALCVDCADLGHLVLLPSGNSALSRRARQASGLCVLVMRFTKSRKRYERVGILVEQAAVEDAESRCLADSEVRERRRHRDRARRAAEDEVFRYAFADRIQELFPGIPAHRATAIADHAAVRSSGRVGRSAAARALAPSAVLLAVSAAIRHEDTEYDTLLMTGTPRSQARHQIHPQVEATLATWRHPPPP